MQIRFRFDNVQYFPVLGNHAPFRPENPRTLFERTSHQGIDWLNDLSMTLWMNAVAALDTKAMVQLSRTCKTMNFILKDHKKTPVNQLENISNTSIEESLFGILSNEILLRISTFLDGKSVAQLSMTCKLLCLMANKDELREEIFIEKYKDSVQKEKLEVGNIFREAMERTLAKMRYPFFNPAPLPRYEQMDYMPEERERGIEIAGNNVEEDNQWRFDVD